jgi:hypothetical protein
VPPCMGALEPCPLVLGGHRPASITTSSPRLDAPKSAYGGTAFANVRFAQFWVEARKWAALQASWAQGTSTSVPFPLEKHWWPPERSCANPW